MFLHQVKLNWKKYRKLTIVILLISFIRMFGEVSLGWAPLNYIGVLRLALIAIAGFAGLAFLETFLDLGIARYRALCRFLTALRGFCRHYWSDKTTAV